MEMRKLFEALAENHPEWVDKIRADERAKTIDEFLSKVKILLCEPFVFEWLKFTDFVRIAEEMKGEQNG